MFGPTCERPCFTPIQHEVVKTHCTFKAVDSSLFMMMVIMWSVRKTLAFLPLERTLNLIFHSSMKIVLG